MSDRPVSAWPWLGLGSPAVTPFSDDVVAPDLASLAGRLSFLVGAGGLLFVAGDTGEVPSKDAVALAGGRVRPPLVSLDRRSADEAAVEARLLADLAEVPA